MRRRVMLALVRAKEKSFLSRIRSSDPTEAKIKFSNISLTASNSRDRRQISTFNLAAHEEFDHLKEGMAKMKAMFIDAQNEIVGLRQILDSDQQAVDDEEVPVENIYDDAIKRKNDGMKVIIRKVTPADVERSLQTLETENRNAKSGFREAQSKFFKAMAEIDKFAGAVTSLQPLKFDLVNAHDSVEEKMIDLDSQIKLFKEGLADNPLSWWCSKSNLLSKVRPAIDEEVVKVLTAEIDVLQSLIGELESKQFKVDEEIKKLKQSGNVSWRIEDEVEELRIEFDRCKATSHYVILDQKYVESKTVSKGYELLRTVSSMQNQVFEKKCAVVKALKEHKKLENVRENEASSGHDSHKYWTMLKRMKSVLIELDAEMKQLDFDIHDAINKKYSVLQKEKDESDEGDDEEEDDEI